MKTKTFPLANILSITTGRLCCDIDGVYEILNLITGDNLFTHVLPRASRFAKPFILEQWPELSRADSAKNIARLDELLDCVKHHPDQTAASAVNMWMEWMSEPSQCNLKPEYEIAEHADAWISLNPIEELNNMVGKENVITVTA